MAIIGMAKNEEIKNGIENVKKNLKKLGYINIYHVKERDYKKNPDKVVDDCLAFIKGK